MKRALGISARLLVAATLGVSVLLILVPALLGLQRYVIVGGSMTGTIDKGSIVYSRLVPVSRLKVGDIITFVPPGEASPVTHRIVAISAAQDGRRLFQTKGDFNPVKDPWQVNLPGPHAARCLFHIPYLGYLLAALAIRRVRMIVIGLPAVVIALSLLWSLWTKAGEEAARQEASPVAEAALAKPARDNIS